MIHLLCFILLCAPLIVELIDDRSGDRNKGQDVFVRILIGLVASIINFFVIDKAIVDSFVLSMAIFFFAFDYAISYILIKKGIIETKLSWFEYMGKSSKIDSIGWWNQTKPLHRFYIRLGVLTGALIIYFV